VANNAADLGRASLVGKVNCFQFLFLILQWQKVVTTGMVVYPKQIFLLCNIGETEKRHKNCATIRCYQAQSHAPLTLSSGQVATHSNKVQ